MKEVKNSNKDVVSFAWDIIAINDRMLIAEAKVERLKKIELDYIDLLNSSIQHNEKMMANVLVATMKGNKKERNK